MTQISKQLAWELEGCSMVALDSSEYALDSACAVDGPVTSPSEGHRKCEALPPPPPLPTPPSPQPYPMSASFPDLLNCGLFLNGSLGKPGLDWTPLTDLKEANREGLGLVCFLCFHGAQTSPKGKEVIPGANTCVSMKT